ncbi:uncharacterized protein LOC131663342 [Phymastichus coffea]|uniref:uncharacterized protein LOC131663342 n=1 Tax=Phymastichus coffea TaxID=108790 RepID=UPI00273C8BCF|nr:uncharacterized protein LOC131663342 [Phymastichus coffea]
MYLRTAQGDIVVRACSKSVPEDDCPVLRATALVNVVSPDGREIGDRALLDQGSEATFVSESFVQLLGLSKDRIHTNLIGVGGCAAGSVKSATRFTLRSRSDASFQKQVNAFILPRLTFDLPSRVSTKQDLTQLEVLPLADPSFYTPGRIDLMIGADLYGQLLRPGLKQVSSSGLVVQNTALGWIISGPTYTPSARWAVHTNYTSIKVLRCVVNNDLSELLQRFWTLEEVPAVTDSLKPDDEACEKLFTETHKRGSDGHYQVRLQRVGEIPRVGMETQCMALLSLTHQHKRLACDPQLNRAYTEFMQAYYELGHMEWVPDHERNNPYAWYLPHHAVKQATTIRPKIRVVFDASRQTRDKHSLNDFLMAGPPLQSDLDLTLLNWRRYRYGFTADIVKMFRQSRVAREDQDLQRIIWSPVAESPPIHYRLTMVTYGTSCAPYLAIRTLQHLARDEGKRFPLGTACLESETYVDDTFSGADDLTSAMQKRDELIAILKSAGVELNKWTATHPELLPSSMTQGNGCASKEIDSEKAVKTLGVHWSPSPDCFSFTAGEIECHRENLTKRTISSDIARLFDPLGWLAPITMTAKTILQDLWLEKLGLSQRKSYEVHGFLDASKRAYAAAVYLRIDNGYGTFTVSLLAAKTKVGPVKTVSIPNLELLVRHLQRFEFVRSAPVRLWSNSRIVLMWLKKHPCHWRSFVANRVSLIQTELPSVTWDHVPTKQNPADIASRGATPIELKLLDLWWQGPPWLASHSQTWPQPLETVQVLHTKPRNDEPEVLSRYSTLTRLTRVIAWCLQYMRCKAQEGLYTPFLSTAELDNARQVILKLAQSHAFAREIELLRNGKGLPKWHALHSLRPFLDSDGVLRVGGRLSNAPLPSHVRNPPILPRQSALSRLFVTHAHCKALHGGPTLTTSVLLRFAWIIGMRALIKSTIRKCVKCQCYKSRLAYQLMGNLPAERVTPARPFTTTGLDYAGPFQAIHLEVVSDLTTATFIAAFRRFVSRRGLFKQLVSDNATTFRGADAELWAMFRAGSTFFQEVASTLANDGITWTFKPPNHTPLRRRFVGEHTLTFEELSTVLAEIESCLNSRPLCPLTSDPEDLQALTPSHFLIDATSGLTLDEETPTVPINRLSRFQLLQRIRDQFWKRWTSEYMLLLQERTKWMHTTSNFAVGQLVFLKDDRYPAFKWPLGRVQETHAVRVVTVKTANNTLRRHVACLAPLMLDQSKNQEDSAKREESTCKN